MPSSTHHGTWGLTRLMLRARTLRWATLITALASAAILALLLVAQTITLSGGQRANKLLGSAEASYGWLPESRLGVAPAQSDRELLAAARQAGATHTRLERFAFVEDGVDKHYRWSLQQTDWASDPYPGNFTLVSGTLPRRPEEACVSSDIATTTPVGSTETLFGGVLHVNITCEFRSSYLSSPKTLYVAPGTLESAQTPDAAKTAWRWDTPISASLFFDAPNPQAVSEALLAAAPPDNFETFGSLVLTRNSLTADHRSDQDGLASPLLFAIPRWLLPGLGGFLTTVIAQRTWRRARRIFWTLGVPEGTSSAAIALSSVIATVVAACAGSAVGVALGFGWRTWYRASTGLVVGPVVGVLSTALVVAAAAAAGAAVGLGTGRLQHWIGLHRAKVQTRREARSNEHVAHSRRNSNGLEWRTILTLCAACLLLGAGYGIAQAINSTTAFFSSALLLGLAIIVCIPGGLRLATRRPLTAQPEELGRRQLRSHRGTGVTATILAFLVMGGTVFPTMTLINDATANRDAVSLYPEHQAWLSFGDWDTRDRVTSLRNEIDKYSDLQGRPFTQLDALTNAGDGALISFPHVADLEAILGQKISVEQQKKLKEGFILRTQNTPTEGLKVLGENDKVEATLKTLQFPSNNPTLSHNYGGFLLDSAAQAAHLKPAVAGYYYTDLSNQQLAKMRRAPQDLHFNEQWLGTYEEQDQSVSPRQFWIVGGSVALLSIAVCTLLGTSLSKSLRPTVGSLWALGLGRRWLMRPLGYQLGLAVGVGATVGLVAGLAATYAVASISEVGFVWTVPWPFLGVLVLGILVGLGLAMFMALHRLRPDTRAE